MSDLHRADKLLVRRLLAGDEEAFDRFFESSFAALFRFAVTRLGNDADAAEDVVQTTLSEALTKLATYRGEAALFTWLCTFCRHEISAYYVRHQRTSQTRPLQEEVPEIRAALESLSALNPDAPDEGLRRRELARLVQVTLDCLPQRYGNALEWKYIQELPVVEIAGRLNVSAKAAESLLTRAREAFRDGFRAVCADAKVWER